MMEVDLFGGDGGSDSLDVDLFSKGKKPLRGQSQPEVDLFGEKPSFSGAIGSTLIHGPQQSVGGMMEAAGNLISPEDTTYAGEMEKALRANAGKGAPALVGGLVEAAANTTRKKLTREAITPGGEIDLFGKNLAGAGAEFADQEREAIRKATPTDLNLFQEAGLSAINSAAQMAPLVVANRLGLRSGFTQAAGLGQFGATQFGQSYNEAKAAGAAPDDALKAALLSGGSEIVTEKMGLDTLLKGGSNWFKKFLAQEIGGEEVATITQSLFEKGLYNPDKWSSADEIVHDLAVTALSAAGGAGMVKGLDYTSQKALQTLGKEKATREEESHGALRELSRQSEEIYRAQMGVDNTLPTLEDGTLSNPVTRVVRQADGTQAEIPFIPTPEEEALAVIQKEQMAKGLDVPATDAAIKYGLELTEGLGQGALEENLLGEQDTLDGLRDSGGVSALVQARRAEDPNLVSIPTALRPIVGASDGRVIGLTLGQTGIQPKGSVVVVGELNENFPAQIVEPLRKLYEEFTTKYMPEARVIIDLARLSKDDFGRHQLVVGSDGEMTHVISPMDMLNIGRHGVSDEKTAMSLMMAASHEFGHALTSQALPDGLKGKIDPLLIAELNKQAMRGVVSSKVLNALKQSAPVEAAVVGDWLNLRKEVVSGKMTAAEFMEKWVGGRKLGSAVKKTERNQSLYAWAEDRLGGRIEGKTALELVLAPLVQVGESKTAQEKYLKEYLSLQEYMAEQFSKHAYSSGDIGGSALARLFPATMQKLRDMFIRLKTWSGISGEKIIKPGTTFAEWMDSLTLRAKESGFKGTNFELSPALMKKQRALVKAAGKKALEANKTKNEKKEEKLTAELESILAGKKRVKGQSAPSKEENGSLVEMKKKAGDMLDQLFVADQITVKMEERYRDMIARGDVQSVFEKLSAMMEKRGMMDRDYTSKVLARLPNKASIKAETLRSTLKMQDIKASERAMWERFLLAHPEGFSPEEAKAAVVANAMPLEMSLTGQYAEVGLGVLDGIQYSTAMSRVWEGPVQTGGSTHFTNPNYVMHSRFVDAPGKRWILELQSDLFQNFEQVFPEDVSSVTEELEGALERSEHIQLLIGELEESVKEGDPKIYLDEGSLRSVGFGEEMSKTIMGSQNQLAILSALQGFKMGLDGQVAEVQARAERLAQEGPIEQLRDTSQNWWERLIKEEIAEATVDGQGIIYFPSATAVTEIEGWDLADPGVYAQVKGIYARYASTIPKYLKKNFNAVEVEFKGNVWYAVDPLIQGEKIGLYDRDNPYSSRDPGVVLDELAGLTAEEFRNPERVAEAQGFWERLGKESPYFKRWFGNSQVDKMVWRGTGNPVAFLDHTTMGGLTGVPSARKAFWFSDNKSNAEYYATQAVLSRKQVLKEEHRRDAASLRKSIAQAKELLRVVPEEDLERQSLLRKVISRDTDKLAALNLNPENLEDSAPTVRGHYLRMENPFVVEGVHYGDAEWDLALDMAIRGGHDGVIYKNAFDPFLGTVYAVFSSDQVKADSNMGTFDPTDNLHWDRDSPVQQGLRTTSKLVQNGWDEGKLRGLNLLARVQDNLIQLQQMAASQPDNPTLQGFMRVKREADSLKNKLMGRAEETAKKLMSVTGSSDALRKQLHSILKEEWKGGVLQGRLVGKDAWGNAVFGGELGDTGKEQRGLVTSWEVEDSLGLRQFFQKQGVDVESEAGKKLLDMYLEVRNTFNQEFYELGLALKSKAEKAFGNTPLVRNVEFHSIDELVFKQVASPFVPVGNFGDWAVIVKRGRDTVKIVHYENEAAYDKGYKEALRLAQNDPNVHVKGKKLNEGERGMMIPLPQGFLEKLASTGEFTDDHLELLQDVLQVGKYDKINERYEKISRQMDGSSEDFARVFADYTWHNSNFIWKMKHRAKFQDVLKAGRKGIRELERDTLTPLEEKTAGLKRLRRNQELMEHQMNYILKPQDEFQNVRGYISLAYLSFGVKTAVMNLSTHLNTMAAITTEYGEKEGVKHYSKAWGNFWTILRVAEARRDGVSVELTPEQQKNGLDPMVWAMGKAMEEGIIDQSFAYFLAGQSNSNAFMRAVQTNRISAIAARTLEFGMWPFQMVEKLNRIIALQSFFSAGMEENKREGNWRSLQEVYEKASRRVDQTQNAYDPANRAKILQGKKALLTMFMSYTLFQGHVMLGGLDKAVKADISRENQQRVERGLEPKAMPNVLRNSTTKLWLMYLLLSGGLGLPFMDNILDVVRLIWKKLWPKEDAEVELRSFIQELGVDSNLVLHGVLHDVGGFDVSGSFGLGRLIPGTNLIGKSYKTKEEAFGAMASGASGPAGSFFLALIQASMELSKGNVAEAGKAMPGAIGAVSKATDAALKQANRPTYGVTTKAGQRLTMDLETGEFRDLTTTELVGMALGFSPTMTKVNRELHYRITSEGLYWQIRKQDLLDKRREAVVTHDEEGRKSVDEEIQKFNNDVPSGKMRITGKTKADSLRTWRKGVAMSERYGTKTKGLREFAGNATDAYMGGGESNGE